MWDFSNMTCEWRKYFCGPIITAVNKTRQTLGSQPVFWDVMTFFLTGHRPSRKMNMRSIGHKHSTTHLLLHKKKIPTAFISRRDSKTSSIGHFFSLLDHNTLLLLLRRKKGKTCSSVRYLEPDSLNKHRSILLFLTSQKGPFLLSTLKSDRRHGRHGKRNSGAGY